jgi:SAM-dependent methyltransferase
LPTAQYQDGSYLARFPTWHEEDSPWKASQIVDMIRRHSLSPNSVCEIGCGAGAVLAALRRQLGPPCRFVGYDVSPQAIERCAAHADDLLSFVQGDIRGAQSGHDLVLCIDVIEHVEDCFGFLRELRAKGAMKILHIPIELSVERVILNRFLESRREYGHVHVFNRDTALELLRDCGYEIVDWRYTPAALALPAHRLGNRLARIPRRVLSWISPELCSRLLGGWSLLVLAK